MKLYLNAGFGYPLGSMLPVIRGLGFDGVRQDCPPGREVELIREFAPGHPGASLRPLFIVNGGKMDEDPEPAGARASQVALTMYNLGVQGEIEIGNEPDIARKRYADEPAELALSVCTAFDIINRDRRLKDTKLVTGGISTTSKKALGYLEAMLRNVPMEVAVGYHTYRTTTSARGHLDGFQSREHEFDTLRLIAGTREIWNTEVGWHTAPSKVGCWPFKKTIQFTDNDVFAFLKEEIEYNREGCAVVMTVYQLNDGPTNTWEDRFGIRRTDGTWKPQSEIARR